MVKCGGGAGAGGGAGGAGQDEQPQSDRLSTLSGVLISGHHDRQGYHQYDPPPVPCLKAAR